MKKIISIIFSLCLVLCVSAQAVSPHMTFKGIPIDGTIESFSQKLVEKGFTVVGANSQMVALSGTFAGFEGCTVAVNSLEKKNLTSMVVVMFPEKDKWAVLEAQYAYLKDMLTEKYGKAAKNTEAFKGQVGNEDKDKLQKLIADECTYESVFATAYGVIKLQISHAKSAKCYVSLGYIDAKNSDPKRQAAMDDV